MALSIKLHDKDRADGHTIRPVLLCSLTALTTTLAAAFIALFFLGREKFIDGEFKLFEQFTGPVAFATFTLFIGNTEVIGRDEQLNISADANDGKDAQRHI